MSIRRIAAVDIEGIYWQAFHARESQASDLALSVIRRVAEHNDRVVICCGPGRRPLYRSKLWPGYKAKRRERPEHGWAIMAQTVETCRSEGWHILSAPEHPDHHGFFYEADDVVGAVVGWASGHGFAVDIVGNDSDLAQLIADGAPSVRLIRWLDGNLVPMNEATATKWLGYHPSWTVAVKALAGDSTDGYGDLFPGVGDGTAKKILQWATDGKRGLDPITLAGIIQQGCGNEPWKGKVYQTIAERAGNAIIGVDLATIPRTLPGLDCSVVLHSLAATAPPETTTPLEPAVDADGLREAEDEFSKANREIEAEELPEVAAARASDVPTVPQSAALMRVDPTARMLTSPAEMTARMRALAALIRAIFRPNVHQMKIPGTDRPTLLKPGAEVLAEAYGYRPEYTIEGMREDFAALDRKLVESAYRAIHTGEADRGKKMLHRALISSDTPFVFYRVRCRLYRKADGMIVGECVRSASSAESKWSGRWAYERDVPEHLDISTLPSREFTAKKGEHKGEKFRQYRVPNPEPFDVLNTVLAMAQKRAFVGAVVTACRASAAFATDLEDIKIIRGDDYGTEAERPEWEG